MATFDRERREIVVRIVYDGAATAGKTANLRSLNASFGQRARGGLYAPEESATGRTLYFDSLDLETGHVEDWQLRCQIITVPGQLAFAERRYRLLRNVDAIVIVCESTPRGVRAARASLAFLDKALDDGRGRLPMVIQANKQDLPDALSPEAIEEQLVPGRGHRVIGASALHGDGVRPTFLEALGAARNAVRERLIEGGPESLGPPLEIAEQLYETMLQLDGEPEPVVTAMVDELLAGAGEGPAGGKPGE